MIAVTLARRAMATRFELVLYGDHAPSLQAAGEEALDEIERCDAQFSLYRAGSAVADLNARAHRRPVRVDPRLFHLLQTARQLHADTAGAFDVTVGPLVRCWGFMGPRGAPPSPAALAEARDRVGMQWVALDPDRCTVRFLREGMMLDLGAIGKGHAIEQAVQLLADAGITRALLHGGTSTIATLGAPPDADAWHVGIALPPPSPASAPPPPAAPAPAPALRNPVLRVCTGAWAAQPPADQAPLAVVPLRDASLSVSAAHGKSFEAGGQTCGHVLDPRTGHPAAAAHLAAVVWSSATESDALSTALLALGVGGLDLLRQRRRALKGLVVQPGAGGPAPFRVEARGIDVRV